ncbi:MAG: hypothetical protein WCA78_00565 [Rhizomicrobium sp.]
MNWLQYGEYVAGIVVGLILARLIVAAIAVAWRRMHPVAPSDWMAQHLIQTTPKGRR